jgi:hypothetical protein
MKRLPFNACDYRCDRCLETVECAVFQKLQERSLQSWIGSNSGNDSSDVLRDIRESFRETEARIKQKAQDFGIDLDGIAGVPSSEEMEGQLRGAMEDPLYKRAYDFTMQTHEFLRAAERLVDGEAREYFDDIAWHHTVVVAKVYRTVIWKTHEEGAIDAKRSAAVAVKSLTICIMAFEYLASRSPALSQECGRLLAAARGIKEEIRERIKPARAA